MKKDGGCGVPIRNINLKVSCIYSIEYMLVSCSDRMRGNGMIADKLVSKRRHVA